ncbi:MAG TPA: crossover junction endodeoxyribonuclease RuvC [Patescibacteria group bacterium]|nr:crossover junction endodeoxyribonuclease RuvC [Patescibacteria group bacterium]
MRIVGIDPGIGRTGWGTIETQGSSLKPLSYGCFETEPNSPLVQRLTLIYEWLEKLLEEEKPDELAIEDLFFNTNAKTALIVGQARGVVLLTAGLKHIPVSVYTPLQVKMALTGYGRAQKPQVGQMVKTLLKLSTIPKPDDTADALAIALTHAFSRKVNAQKMKVNS